MPLSLFTLVVRFQPIHLSRNDQSGYHPRHPALDLVILSVENFYLFAGTIHHPVAASSAGTTGSCVTLCCCVVHLRRRRGIRSKPERMNHWAAEPTSPFSLLTFAVLFPTSSTKYPQTRRLTRPSAAAAPAADRYRWWASTSSMGRKAGKLMLLLQFASVAPGIRRRMGRRIGGPPDLRDRQPWMNQTKDPEARRRRARGVPAPCFSPRPARRLRRSAAVRAQIRWRTADASTDERHRQAWLGVGPIGQREGHQDNVKVRQHQAATIASPSVKL